MIKLLTIVIVAGLIYECWTPWFDRESITDDWETFQYLHREHPEEICPNPVDIQTNGQNIRFSCYPPFCGGGVCWTRWFDSVRSKGSVSVQISRATCDYPLYIEAVTVKSMTPAIDTGEIFKTYCPHVAKKCILQVWQEDENSYDKDDRDVTFRG
ncbi:hypothetical protein E3U43_017462 [Larimichthys crocea]|uniref:Uncharacterized protein n=1 Tax=Larimichthys crocea TaxID=215358 RepID=A0ACD3R051_LARCR|nr:hypothetical protein E3U43_017462 [Larimichthys crocea]